MSGQSSRRRSIPTRARGPGPGPVAVPDSGHLAEPVAAPVTAEAPRTVTDLRGCLDSIRPDGRVFGWCWSPEEPKTRRLISIVLDGKVATSALADVLRGDLLAAGVGDGGHGFLAEIPAELRQGGPVVATLLDAATGLQVGGEMSVTWLAGPGPPPPLVGNLDVITRDGWVSGWCWDPAAPDTRLRLEVYVDDDLANSAIADEDRADLRQAGVGDGRYGFNIVIPYEVLAERGTVQIRVAEHGTGRPLGEPTLMRIGRRAEQETRLLELERQITLMRGRIEQLLRSRSEQPEIEAKASRQLFATVASFFQDLADGLPPAGSPERLAGSIAESLGELRRILPELSLRPAIEGPHGVPLATIAIQAGDVMQVHACLTALREVGLDLLADIVLLDSHSGGDARCALLPSLVANLRAASIAPHPVAGFARLLREADTPLVGFLAPDVRPSGGWFATMAATFAETLAKGARPALVGSSVIRPDGLLHYGGLMLNMDRRLRDPGFLAVADQSEHRFMRPVDALAPLALLADRNRVAEAGGLDPSYEVFGAALADLCLRARARGFEVLGQPAAEAVWAGPDVVEPVYALPGPLDSEDGRRLRLVLARHYQDGRERADFVGHALVVDQDLPVPSRDAGSWIAVEQMLVLRRLGWRVTFATAGREAPAAADRRRLEQAGIEVADVVGDVTEILRAHGANLGLVHLHRHRVAALMLPRVRDIAPKARILFSPADLHFLREERRAALMGIESDNPETTRATKLRELRCVREADATILHSDHEKQVLAQALGADFKPATLHLLRWIARPAGSPPPFAARANLLFVGSFRHSPNVDAMLWYAREVVPILRNLRPGLVLEIVGADAPLSVLDLEGPEIRVRGWVEALSPILDAARLTIAPLRYGAGFKGKVATSLAAGVPVVGTTIAAEGTGLADGDGIAIADEPEAFARAIIRLHDDSMLWEDQSRRALERVAALYSPDSAARVFRSILGQFRLPAAS